MASTTTKGLGQLAIVIIVIVCIIGFFFKYFSGAKLAAMDAKKKAELTQIYTLIQFYYVGENAAPRNPDGNTWCAIGELPGNEGCLNDVVRDGYIKAIPPSPDDKPYLYHSDDKKFLVATRMNKKLAKNKMCPHSEDPYMWCKVFNKNTDENEK